MSALNLCRGCGAAWIDPDCTCSCEEGDELYEHWVTIDTLAISQWVAKQRVGYAGGVRHQILNQEPSPGFGGFTLLDLIAALTLAASQRAGVVEPTEPTASEIEAAAKAMYEPTTSPLREGPSWDSGIWQKLARSALVAAGGATTPEGDQHEH